MKEEKERKEKEMEEANSREGEREEGQDSKSKNRRRWGEGGGGEKTGHSNIPPVLHFQFTGHFALELGQQLLQQLLDGVSVGLLRWATLLVGKLESAGTAIMHHYLKLNLVFAVW